MPQGKTRSEIYAPPTQVWQILTDLPAYPRWNPFLRFVEGRLQPGEPLTVHIAFPGSRIWAFQARVIACDPERTLHWQGYHWKPYLLSADYVFELETLEPERILLTQRLAYRGLLAPFLPGVGGKSAQHGLLDMLQALKVEVEGVESSTSSWHA